MICHLTCYFVNPSVFTIIVKSCVLLGNWKQRILQDIDADQLPVHWGGTQTDPDGDPFCRSKVSAMTPLVNQKPCGSNSGIM